MYNYIQCIIIRKLITNIHVQKRTCTYIYICTCILYIHWNISFSLLKALLLNWLTKVHRGLEVKCGIPTLSM